MRNVLVYALTGPSGTGKSHRASMLARQLGVELIIDDGLLIKGSKILGGKSAKREETRLGAVRRAVFQELGHAEEIKDLIHHEAPERILILGTSAKMIRRITDRLGLPEPEKYLDITEIASPQEIRRARSIRRQYGKHVIPAPTFEVKKGFSGYLIDPLRFLYRGQSWREKDVVIEKSTVRPTFSSLGRFFIADSVVAEIARRATAEVEGVAGAGRILVQVKPEGVVLSIDLHLLQGFRIPEVLRKAQRRAKDMVELMTALNVQAIDVTARKLVIQAGGEEGGKGA